MPHRKKILLSDSDEAFSMLLTDSLHERGGFHVFHARDEDETAEALHRHRPHILLLDFLLPHKGGFHVMERMHEGGHKLSTIFMTALPTHKVVDEAYRLGQALYSRSLSRQGRWSNGYTMCCMAAHPERYRQSRLDKTRTTLFVVRVFAYENKSRTGLSAIGLPHDLFYTELISYF